MAVEGRPEWPHTTGSGSSPARSQVAESPEIGLMHGYRPLGLGGSAAHTAPTIRGPSPSAFALIAFADYIGRSAKIWALKVEVLLPPGNGKERQRC